MSGLPWSKFFWADWRSDPGLRACSAHARGVWMDCLCIAAEADPTGYVLVNGRSPTTTDLARLTGEPEAAVQSALEELERNGVFSRDRNGRIYNRRMIRDIRKAAINRKNGKEGGNPEIRRGMVPKKDRVRPFRRSDNPAKTRRIFDRSNGRCHWCHVELVWESDELVKNFFHVDHVIPVCDGGSNDEENLVASCAECNHARARKDWGNSPDTNPDNNPDTKPQKPRSQKPDIEEEEKPRENPGGEVVQLPRARRAADHAFEGRIVKLGQADFDRWRSAYSNIPDLRSELTAIDDTLAEAGHTGAWFVKVSHWLQAKHSRLAPKPRPFVIGIG